MSSYDISSFRLILDSLGVSPANKCTLATTDITVDIITVKVYELKRCRLLSIPFQCTLANLRQNGSLLGWCLIPFGFFLKMAIECCTVIFTMMCSHFDLFNLSLWQFIVRQRCSRLRNDTFHCSLHV